jgi:oligogalacturonide lyase
MIVGDGSGVSEAANQPFIQLFQWDGESYRGPKILAIHRSTFNGQHAHCHPRFTPGSKQILFTSDATGYSNMYLVELETFDKLPDLDSSAIVTVQP